MTPSFSPSPDLTNRLHTAGRRALLAGAAALAICIAGAFADPAQFFRSYLMAYLLWLGVALGSLAILMLQYLTGGAWGVVIRRMLESAMQTLPFLALLFIPILIGIPSLYVWARPDAVAADEILRHKQIYLNPSFFVARAFAYFAIWITFSLLLNHWSAQQDRTGRPASGAFQRLSAAGLIVYGCTVTLAAIDWVMSIQPHFYSTIFGVLLMAGQALSALSFILVVVAGYSTSEPLATVIRRRHLQDLGKLLLMFLMLWAYFAFSQLLIVWSGNLPREILWYVARLGTGWQWVGLTLVVLQFFLPFLLLLSRNLKSRRRSIVAIAMIILIMRAVDLFWMVEPSFRTGGFHLHWMDVLAPIGIGGIWLAMFFSRLGKQPLLPVRDPHLEEALAHGRA